MEERFFKQGTSRFIETGQTGEVLALQLQGGQAFAGASDGQIKQFDVATQKEISAFKGHTDWVFALDHHPASKRLISGGYDGEVKVWNTESGECLKSFRAMVK